MVRKKGGFTLVEMVLVIAIIGLLAVVLFAAMNPLTQIKKARDSRRKEEMKKVQVGFEQYYSYYNTYVRAGNSDCLPIFSDSVSGLRGQVPADPVFSGTNPGEEEYLFWCDPAGGQSFCICATMEIPGNGNNTNRQCLATSWTNRGSYYCIENSQ